MKINSPKILTPASALLKLQRYCAYQERCHQEVRKKIEGFGVKGEEAEWIVSMLIEQNFLNEERFAILFAGGKFRIKKWGRIKIIRQLKQKNISEYCIRKAMEEIKEENYLQCLKNLAEEKFFKLKDENIYIKKDKTSKFLLAKGYEPELIWETLKSF